MAERTIRPSAGRLRRGWRAGVRGRSSWLDTAVALVVVGSVLGAIPWDVASGIGARWKASIAAPDRIAGLLSEFVVAALLVAAALAAGFGVARLLSAALARRLGPVDRSGLARLGVGPRSSRGAIILMSAALLGLAIGAVGVRDVIAPAARAVDATPSGVAELWAAWPRRALLVAGAVLGVLGWVELGVGRLRNRLRLSQTHEQARAELRSRGGRS